MTERPGNVNPGLAEFVCAYEMENGSGRCLKGESLEADFLVTGVLGARAVGETVCRTGKVLQAFLC